MLFMKHFLLCTFAGTKLATTVAAAPGGYPVAGSPLCPCITSFPVNLTYADIAYKENIGSDPWSHGLGCKLHDINLDQCEGYRNCTSSVTQDRLTLPNDQFPCHESAWCGKEWCYVDPNNCDRLSSKATFAFSFEVHWSYAACGELDSYADVSPFNAVREETFQVGFNRNSGGWEGAYSHKELHFEGPGNIWYGPTVDFVKEAAVLGGFEVNLATPPDIIRNKSIEHSSASEFDLCVYAIALGYLDFCVAKYTITDQRARTAKFFVLDSAPIYLVTEVDKGPTGVAEFKEKFLIIFQPFSEGTWLLIIFVFCPFLALTIMIQEYGVKGSDFPATEKQTVQDDSTMQVDEIDVPYPLWKNATRALYRSFLSYLRRFYGQQVVTYGGAWTVLAFCFIGMIGMSLYTAQMAAHLTTEGFKAPVTSLSEALGAGYRLCGERKTIDSLARNANIWNRFVGDPVELGGDGQPGFNCDNCFPLALSLDRIDAVKAATDPSYCHAALVAGDQLEAAQAEGRHCDKISVGQPVSYVNHGFPLSEEFADRLNPLLTTMKNNGVYDSKKVEAKPSSLCPVPQPKVKSLTPYDLIGIWITCGGFAIIGLIVSFFERRHVLKKGAHAVAKGSVQWVKKQGGQSLRRTKSQNNGADKSEPRTSIERSLRPSASELSITY